MSDDSLQQLDQVKEIIQSYHPYFLQSFSEREHAIFEDFMQNRRTMTKEDRDVVTKIIGFFLEYIASAEKVFNAAQYDEQKRVKKVDHYVIPQSTLITEIQQNFTSKYFDEEIQTAVDKSSKINIYYELSFMDENVQFTKPLTAFDRVVFNVAVSMYTAGNDYFSIDQFARVLTVSKKAQNITEERKQKIKDSIEKLLRTRVRINCAEQTERWTGKNNLLLEYEGYLLPLSRMQVRARNGSIVDVYRILEEPVLYTYSKAVMQVSTVEMRMLDTANVIRNTDDVLLIKNYLVHRIAMMKNPSCKMKNKNTILFDTIYQNCDIVFNTSNSRVKKKRLVESMELLLQYWQSEHYIAAYTMEKTKIVIRDAL